MGPISRVSLAVLTALSLQAGVASAADPAPPAVEIVNAEFGIFDDSKKGELAFEPGTVVPHRVGQRYGWVIELRTKKRSVAVREEYLLPSKATAKELEPGGGGSMVIPMERVSQVSQRQLVPVGGKIYGVWSVGPQEPDGHRHLQVVVEGQVAASFEYDVK